MKAGKVVSIRVNPRDCQSTLDVLEKAGISVRGMSFAQIVSLSFSSLLESARKANLIPEPDEFQYLNRMQPYIGRMHNGRKAQVTKEIGGLGPTLRAPAVQDFEEPEAAPAPAATAPQEMSAEDREVMRSASARLTELLAKKDIAEGNPNVIWSPTDEREYQECMKLLYPDG